MRHLYQSFIVIGSIVNIFLMAWISDWGRALTSDLFMLQPLAYLLAFLLGGTSLFYLIYLARALSYFDGKFLWQDHLKQVGIWLPLLCLVCLWSLLLAVLLKADWEFIASLPVQYILIGTITLFAGLHSALLFSPDDEPIIELLLSFPYALSKLIAGRFLIMLIIYLLLGLISQLLILPQLTITFLEALSLWIPELILFSAIGLLITIMTRKSIFGVGMVLILWAAFFLNGSAILGNAPYLYNIYFFPLDIWPQPELFFINRLTVFLLGSFCFTWALSFLSREESVLSTSHS
ncbi:hypothetical protein MASR2M15_11950 [Anaerolineales bacterium]